MDEKEYLLGLGTLTMLLIACAAVKLQKRRRRCKTRPLNRSRKISSNYQYYQKMKSWNAEHFFKYTRMSLPAFEKLLEMIRPKIQKQPRSDGISAEEACYNLAVSLILNRKYYKNIYLHT